MIEELNELNKAILDRVNTTKCLSIRDVIRPFLLERSESVLRTRVPIFGTTKLNQNNQNKEGVLCFGTVVPKTTKGAKDGHGL
jgi:hypothetical protein